MTPSRRTQEGYNICTLNGLTTVTNPTGDTATLDHRRFGLLQSMKATMDQIWDLTQLPTPLTLHWKFLH